MKNKYIFAKVMKRLSKQVVKRMLYGLPRVGILLLFIFFFGSITLFNHTHISDGSIIVHSHPYRSDSNDIPIHKHDSNGYNLIHLLNELLSEITFFSSPLFFVSLSITGVIFIISKAFFSGHSKLTFLLRGPPPANLI